MARMIHFDKESFAAWLVDRPVCVQELAARFPPDRLYSYASSGKNVTLEAYHEDGTLTVALTTEYNFTPIFMMLGELANRSVFGVPSEKLVECDLPPEYDNRAGDWVPTGE